MKALAKKDQYTDADIPADVKQHAKAKGISLTGILAFIQFVSQHFPELLANAQLVWNIIKQLIDNLPTPAPTPTPAPAPAPGRQP